MASLEMLLDKISGIDTRTQQMQEQQQVEQARQMERVRGTKFEEQFIQLATPAAFTTVPGPLPGFSWNLKLIAVTLTGSDSLSVWKGGDQQSGAAGTPPNNGRLIGYTGAPGAAPAQAVAWVTWSANQQIVKTGTPLALVTSGAFNIKTVYLSYWNFIAEREGTL
jgi:hypothetical protein